MEISTGLEVVLQIVFSCVRFLYSGDVGGGMGDRGKGAKGQSDGTGCRGRVVR